MDRANTYKNECMQHSGAIFVRIISIKPFLDNKSARARDPYEYSVTPNLFVAELACAGHAPIRAPHHGSCGTVL